MALPKIGVPYYSLKLVSGKNIQFRPFTVKEEKILLLANESKNQKNISNAIKNVLNSCIMQEEGNPPINVEELPVFDVELLFLHIRMKSVGEYSEFKYKCEECEGSPEVSTRLDLRNIIVENNEKKKETKLMLTKEVGVELRYPPFKVLLKNENSSKEKDPFSALEIIKDCIVSVFDANQVYQRKDFTDQDLNEFIDSLTQDQMLKINSFFEDMPKLTYNLEVECPCGLVSSKKLSGIADFF
jgi:hypothetical protein